jgi:UV radiation resistance-associated gene protein
VRSRLDEWKAEIKRRRERLESARSLHEEQKRSEKALEEQVEKERYYYQRISAIQTETAITRRRHTTVLNTLSTVRTTLLQTVSFIFPIEPIEPKDLLFGILELPLPIPIGINDPAPPLTLSSDSSYNEEIMASAMGYVAQVINLLTAYLGDLPPFPVVCLGSRSLIKDPISAMMGPRM